MLERTFDTIGRCSGISPVGYVAPWWELSPNTVDLLLAAGIRHGSSLTEDEGRRVEGAVEGRQPRGPRRRS